MTILNEAFWLSVAVKLILFTSLAGLLGCAAVLSFVLGDDSPKAIGRAAKTAEVCLWTFLAGCLAELLLRSADMAGGLGAALRQWRLVLGTHFGVVWTIRLCVLAAGAAAIRFQKRWLVLAAAVLAAASVTAVGHAAGPGDWTLSTLNDCLHVAATGSWVGGLAVIAGLGSLEPLAPLAIQRFSRLAGICLVVAVVTGILNSRFEVGNIDALLFTLYGRILILKMVLAVCLIQVGAFNRFILLPRLPESHGALTAWVRREAAIGGVILAVTALLTQVSPARHVLHPHDLPTEEAR